MGTAPFFASLLEGRACRRNGSGKENWICKSIAMEMGINTGHGACLGCKTFLHITFNPERQEMDLERFEDYEKSQKARDDVDKIAGNLGYGGQDNG